MQEQNKTPETSEQPKKPELPPFTVSNYSRAKRLAVMLYGPLARVWTRDGQVQVGIEKNGEKTILTTGSDFSAALRAPVETYIKGGFSYEDTKQRVATVSRNALAFEFALPALRQFSEYAEELKRAEEKRNGKSFLRQLLQQVDLIRRFQTRAPVAAATP